MQNVKFKFFKRPTSEQRIHLDYASTTPIHPEILATMQPFFTELWANASAIYREGVIARKAIEDARTELARTLRVRARDITFTSGGTESNNLALIGVVEALHESGRAWSDMEIVSTRIEHASITDTLAYLEKRGVRIVYAPIDTDGLIDVHSFESLLTPQTVLVTFAYANSEVGVVQDVKKISRVVRLFNESHAKQCVVHVDASQAPLWLPCALDQLGVDLMTLDAGKCYGPKGVGVLVHRHGVRLNPFIHGGGQEGGLRSGTENTALVIGAVKAIVRAQAEYGSRSLSVAELRDRGISLLTREVPGSVINGSRSARIANNINISIPGLDTEYATIWLDSRGVACSTKSACGALETTGSQVVREMTGDTDRAISTLRFTLGEESTFADLEKMVGLLKEHIFLMKNKIS